MEGLAMRDPALALALRRLRHERRLSQEALAFKANVTISTLSRVERGESSPTWTTLRSIARALDLSIEELVAAVERERRF
jgi:transcriptional regulator with XRE-family HTH domain